MSSLRIISSKGGLLVCRFSCLRLCVCVCVLLRLVLPCLAFALLASRLPCPQACGKAGQHERALSLLEEMRSEGMNLRRTGEKLWWVFNTCRDRKVKDRAWLLMEVEETRERARLRAKRNANKAAATTAATASVTAA